MNENRRQILEMLAAGKITADEAERLLTAIESGGNVTASSFSGNGGSANGSVATAVKTRAKKGGTTVNVRVPLQFLRAGVRLAALIPAQAHNQLDEAFIKHGVPLTLSQIKPENLEELIDHLDDLTVDVQGNDGRTVKVKVFCE